MNEEGSGSAAPASGGPEDRLGRSRIVNRTPGITHRPPSRRHPKGGWEVRYRDTDNMTRRRTFATKQEALDYQAAVRTDKNRGDFIDPRRGTTPLRVVAEDWYAVTATAGLKPKTRQGCRRILDRHVLPSLGDRPIGKITPSVLRAFLAGLPPHLSPTTKRNIFRTLSPIFKLAVVDGMIRTDPTPQVKLPRAAQTSMLFLTAEQVATLAEAVPPDYRALVYFAAYTGCRSGEIVALRVKNLDTLRGRVTIEESVADVEGTLHFGLPKNGKARTLSIPRSLVEMLAAHLAARPHEPNDPVFPGVHGGTLRHGNFYARHFKPAVRHALPDHLHGLRFHDLRHTHAALLIKQGVNLKAISERLGHSSIAITVDRYGHLYDDHEEPIVAGLEEMFQAVAERATPPLVETATSLEREGTSSREITKV